MATEEHDHVRTLVERILASAGVEATARWVPRLGEDGLSTTQVLETLVTRDGDVHVMHHAARERPTEDDARRIADRTIRMEPPGVPLGDVEAACSQWRHALRRDEQPLVGIDARGDPYVRVPVALLDMAGRLHERRCDTNTGRPLDMEHENVRDLDARRRGRRGVPRVPTVGATLAAVLRTMPDRRTRLRAMMPTVERALDDVARSRRDPIAIVRVSGGDAGLAWTCSDMRFEAKDWRFPGGALVGRELRLDQTIPETLMAAAAGRTLGDLMSDPPFDPHMVISKAVRRRSSPQGTTIVVAGDPVPLETMIREASPGA